LHLLLESTSYKTTFDRSLASLNVSVDENSKINGIYVSAYVDNNLPKLERNATKLILPFAGEWNITWGGDTKELNYHVESQAQKNAFDILIMDAKGKTYKNEGKKNEDYYAFGKELFAPCDGEIVLSVDGVKDNQPGDLNPIYVPGNTVIIKTANNEFLFFAHFKNHSILVKEGQKVKQGQVLGLCGNSGNSSEAHLHFHMQNVENMNIATGVKCYFENIYVNGIPQKDCSPIKNDKISNGKF
jgi:murein DD-endopeptidase MepM/ murein hydrolase activator NlpD